MLQKSTPIQIPTLSKSPRDFDFEGLIQAKRATFYRQQPGSIGWIKNPACRFVVELDMTEKRTLS